MLSFSQFQKLLTEDIKGWMPPYGDEWLFSPYEEHYQNLPPDYLDRYPQFEDDIQKDKKTYSFVFLKKILNQALKDGLVRFGKYRDSMHGNHFFIQFNARHPKGYETALKALKAMNPDRDDEVALSGIPESPVGWGNAKEMARRNKAASQLEKVMPASKARQFLEQKIAEKKARSPKVKTVSEF